MLSGARRTSRSLPLAEQFLKGLLANGASIPASTMYQLAAEKGIAESTLKRAKQKLGVEAEKTGFGDEGLWRWRLPVGEAHQP